MTTLSLVNALWSRVDRRGPDDCWPCSGAWDNGDGYRIIRHEGKNYVAHRIAYELEAGPIPEGHIIDHTCHNLDPACNEGKRCPHRACCNPAHLALSTSRENTLAGRTRAATNAAKTECIRGHPLSGENLLIDNLGYRQCRTCNLMRKARYDRRRRAEAIAKYGRTRGPRNPTA